MARQGGKDRGPFERPPGSGIWWIRYHDQHGREHREKVGSKSQARAAYEARKTDVRQEKFDPEKVARKRRDKSLEEALREYVEELRGLRRPIDAMDRTARMWGIALGACRKTGDTYQVPRKVRAIVT